MEIFNRLSPFYSILIAAFLWALQPTFILAFHQIFGGGELLLPINTAGTALIAAVFLAITGRDTMVTFLGDRQLQRKYFVIVGIDGILVAAAYYFLFVTSEFGRLATSAVYFEAWPIISTLYLFIFFPKDGDRKYIAIMSSLFLFCGFFILNIASGDLIFGKFLIYGVLSALFFGLAVGVIQGFLRRNPIFADATFFPIVIMGRAVMTTLSLIVIIWALGIEVQYLDIGPSGLFAALLMGVLVFFNSALFHTGSFRASSNALGLVSLLSPALAPIIIMALGMDRPDQVFYVGAAFIFAGVAFASRSEDISVEAQVLLSCLLLFGAAIFFTVGEREAGGLSYVDTVSIFYVLLQTNTYSRVIAAREEMSAASVSLYLARRAGNHDRLRAEITRIRLLRLRIGNFSETILITFLGMGTVVVLFLTRPSGLVGDLSGFLISCSIAFMVTMTWSIHLSSFFASVAMPDARRIRVSVRSIILSRAFSYTVMVVLLIWFSALLVYKNRADVELDLMIPTRIQPFVGPR